MLNLSSNNIEDKDDSNSNKELVEEERKHAKDEQPGDKDSLAIVHEDSKLNTENLGTCKGPDHGVHQ